MNSYQNISNEDYTIINNIRFDELISNQDPTNYSMLFFCIKHNLSNKLASRLLYFIYRFMNRPQPTYKKLVNLSFKVIIVSLILLSGIVCLFSVYKIRIELILALIPMTLLLYLFIQVFLDSLNSITIKVADFKVGASEINQALIKKGYEKIFLKQYITNNSSNRHGLIHIRNTSNYVNKTNFLSVRIWPFSMIVLSYNCICQYVRQMCLINKYYLNKCIYADIYDNLDKCCINHLNEIATSILKMHNNVINIDRVIILKNDTPIYCKDAI